MKTNIKTIILSFMLLAFSGAVFAQGAYISAGAYIAEQQDTLWEAADTDTDFTASVGYMFNPNFGLEFDYYGLGKYSVGNAELKTSAIAIAVMLVAPLKSVKLYAKLGAAQVTSKVSSNAGTTFNDADNTEAYGGVGLEFGPKNVGFYLEALYFPNEVSDIIAYGAGVRYWFTK